MADQLFTICNLTAVVGWLLLIFAPARKVPHAIAAFVIPVLISSLYFGLIVARMPGAEGGFSSLTDVARLFEHRFLLLAGWIHYLAFDLFIGAWEVRDARRVGLPHLAVVPCLALTFFLGPIGLLLYLALRTWRTQQVDLLSA